MSGMVSKNPDHEFDSLQPCFYPDEDDMYLCGPDSVHPGKDIWKKFELLTTPILPPSQIEVQENPPGGTPMSWGGVALGGLDWASESLRLPTEGDLWGSADAGDSFETGLGESSHLSSVVIHDSMWNSFSVWEKLERTVREKVQSKGGAAVAPSTAGSASVTAASTAATPNPRNHSSSPAELKHSVLACVDPRVVFPLPQWEPVVSAAGDVSEIWENSSSSKIITEGTAPPMQQDSNSGRHPSSTSDSRANSSSGGDTCSYSDEDGKRHSSANKSVTTVTITKFLQTSTTFASVRTLPNEVILKLCASVHLDHNYAAPFPFLESEDTPPPKKLKHEAPHSVRSITQPKLKSSSPQNSASEVRGRQTKHKIQERQRRHNERLGLITLKSHVPEVAGNEKATIVDILKKATEYIHSLQAEDDRLLLEKKELEERHQELIKKLKFMQTS